MADKALITRRSGTQPVDPNDLAFIGTPAELSTSRGALVELTDESQAKKIEALGYRVKFLPDTDLLKIGNYIIKIKDGQAETQPGVPPELEVPPPFIDIWRHHIVQLKLPPSEEEISLIENVGLDVVEPVSSYGLFVVGEPDRVRTLKANFTFVEWVGPLKPAYKLEPGLLRMQGVIQFLSIGVYPPEERASVVATLNNLNAKNIVEFGPIPVYVGDYLRILAEVNAEHLDELARLPGVRFLEFASAKPGLDGEREAQIIAENVNASNIPVTGYQAWLKCVELSGDGVVIAICDTGVSANKNNNTTGHLDLRGRQKCFKDYTGDDTKPDPHGHGTLVASIALGNGATGSKDSTPANPSTPCGRGTEFLCGQGVAPGAEYFTQNALLGKWPPIDFGCLTTDAVEASSQVMNNSWNDGGVAGAGYTYHARRFDQLVRHPNILSDEQDILTLVFSAGNFGPNPYSIMPPHEAKNIIVVGGSRSYLIGIGDGSIADDIKGIFPGSSRGPARDERILPNIVAPANNVLGAKTRTENAYVHDSGTSLSSSLVSGACALLIEWWLKKISAKPPSPAMIKAMLINGAEDLAGGPDGATVVAHIPNNVQGWGRVSLANIINVPPQADRGPKLFFDQQHELTATGEEYRLLVEPADSSRPMRVTLVWTDAPGAPHCSPALVNDLDLEVIEADSGEVLRGNVFDPSTGFSTTGGYTDILNNIECVYIKNPGKTYEIVVRAATLKRNSRPPFNKSPRQDFALVIDNAK